MRQTKKKKTKTHKHKDLQLGQIGVQFEKVSWNNTDVVII